MNLDSNVSVLGEDRAIGAVLALMRRTGLFSCPLHTNKPRSDPTKFTSFSYFLGHYPKRPVLKHPIQLLATVKLVFLVIVLSSRWCKAVHYRALSAECRWAQYSCLHLGSASCVGLVFYASNALAARRRRWIDMTHAPRCIDT